MAEAEESHHQLEMSPSPPVTADSSSSSIFLQPPAPQLMPIQLTYNNYLLWKSLFIPVLKAYGMLNILAEGREQCPPQFLTSSTTHEDKKENPAYTSWIKRDQMFLTWINASLSPSLLRHTRECISGQALWVHLENLLAESAKSRVLGLKASLQNLDTRKYSSIEDYLKAARKIDDRLEAAGSPVNDREFISHIIEGLQPPYDELVASIRNRPRPITRGELHDLLVSHGERIFDKQVNKCCLKYVCPGIFGLVLFVAIGVFLMVRYGGQ